MIDMRQISPRARQTTPYDWAAISNLYSPADADALASSFPHNYFKTVSGKDQEKVYDYEARALVPMGQNTIMYAEDLSEAWQALARDLCSPAYREAMSNLSGYDLMNAPLEVNLFHYGPGASLGPHVDLMTKLVTHAVYFNKSWDAKEGGCLTILRSSNPEDVAAEILPIVGNSAVIIRSEKSWHAVSRVVDGCNWSRRSLTATFYHKRASSSMWLPGDTTPLHRVNAADM